MLGDSTVCAMVAVKDLDAGKQFYGGTLGLHQVDENPGGVAYKSGDGAIFVYVSDTAGSGKATCASWKVQGMENFIKSLKDKGVKFDHYDVPSATWEGDIAMFGPSKMKVSWFKDPDGNVLSLTEGS